MASLFDDLQVGKRALLSHQAVLKTIGHNLANVSTPGFSRERAELTPVDPLNGVDVATITRVRDRFLDTRLLGEEQTLGKSRAREGVLGRLQAVFDDAAGAGLGSTIDQFFQSFQDLSLDPTNQAQRVVVASRGEQLAATFRGLSARVDQVKADVGAEIGGGVAEANGLVGEIAELNRQIVASRGSSGPNDLLDRRDLLVSRLGQIIGVSVTDHEDGSVQLAITGTGVRLVDGTLTAPLTVTVDAATDTIDLRAGTASVVPASGSLSALLEVRNLAAGAVKQAASDLDALARSVIGEVNRVHAGGAGLAEHSALTAASAVSSAGAPLTAAGLAFPLASGSFTLVVHDGAGALASTVTVPVTAGVTTLDDVRAAIDADPSLTASVSAGRLTVASAPGTTFAVASDSSGALSALGLNTFFTGSGARDMALNPVVSGDARKIAAARADASGLVHPGDGSNALDLARLRAQPVLGGGTSTLGDFYGAFVARIGSEARDATQARDRQESAVQTVQSLQQETSGVSIDEELIALTQSQNAYAAAAKYIATLNDVLDSLLRMV